MNENKEYTDKIFKIIPIANKSELRVLTSTRTDGSVLVDIRKYSLFGGNKSDYMHKPTKKGIKFKLFNIRSVVFGLLDIMVFYKQLDFEKSSDIKELMR